jgi:hypothetical protein
MIKQDPDVALLEVLHPQMLDVPNLINRKHSVTTHITYMAEHMGKFIGTLMTRPPDPVSLLYHLRKMVGHACAAYYQRWYRDGGLVNQAN